MIRRVAFLTCDALADGHPDDRRTVRRAGELGVRIEFVPWRSARRWTEFDAVVVRTPWDYQHHLADFLALLDRIEAAGVPLHNPSAVIRWNADKGYLREIEALGVRVVPSRFVRVESREELRRTCEEVGGGAGAVVKPRIGASGEDAFRIGGHGADDAARLDAAAAALTGREVIVQPFLRSVVEVGEWSATFLDGAVSHLFRKLPGAGEFRSQEEHGGRVEEVEDTHGFLEWIRDATCRVPHLRGLLFHRVDALLDDDGRWCLGELELIEPELYLGTSPGSEARFAEALARRLAGEDGSGVS